MSTKETLSIVVNTLNGIEVRGKENLDRLLGCIQTLEQVICTLHNEEKVAND